MKDIFEALVRLAYNRWYDYRQKSRRRDPAPSVYSMVLCLAMGCLLVNLYQAHKRIAFLEDLANHQAQQLAAKDVIDYHVDTTHEDPDGIDALHGDVPATDEGPPLRRTLDGSETEWKVYGNKWTTTGPHAVLTPPKIHKKRHHHARVGGCERLYRYSHAMIGDPLRVSWPNPPVEEENTASDPGPTHIVDDGMLCIACGPLGQGAQLEGVDTLQTTGPMPVKVCGLGGPCKVEDGKWTIDPASDSDGNQGAAVLRER